MEIFHLDLRGSKLHPQEENCARRYETLEYLALRKRL